MKRHLLITALLTAFVAGCATTGSLAQLRADHDQAEAQAEAAAKHQAAAEKHKEEAGKALAGGLVKAADDDVKAAEAAAKRAKAKKEEACKLNPDLPTCKEKVSPQPPLNPPVADLTSEPTQPVAEPPPPAKEEDEAEENDMFLYFEISPHATLTNTFQLVNVRPPKDGWKLDWKANSILRLTVGKEERAFQRPEAGCYKAFPDRTEKVTCAK